MNLEGRTSAEEVENGWECDVLVMDGLGLGLYPTLEYLYSNHPTYEAFEAWVLAMNGGHIEPSTIDWVNTAIRRVIAAEMPGEDATDRSGRQDPVLSATDLAFWEEHGYVVVSNAISPENSRDAEKAIWEFLGADPDKPDTWFDTSKRDGIWVPLYRHPALDANRQSALHLAGICPALWHRSAFVQHRSSGVQST